MPSGTLAPVARQQFLDVNGKPVAAGLLNTYASGTATRSPIYTDAALTVAHPNPAVLDSGGFLTIYMPALAQKWVLTTSVGAAVWTVDPVSSVGLNASGVYDVVAFGGDSTSPITATTYPSGSGVDKTHAGTGLWVIDSANIASGTYQLNAMILGAGTVTVALVDLLGGSPDVPLATASGSSATGTQVSSGPITFAAPGTAHTYGVKAQVSSGNGFAWAINLVKVG